MANIQIDKELYAYICKFKPEEFATLPDIVLLSPFGFLRVEKAPYYSDKAFM